MNPHLTSRLRFGAFLTLSFCLNLLRGQTIYVGPNNGDWLTAANWSAGLPSAANPATVPGGKIVAINGTLLMDFSVQSFGTIVNNGATTVSATLISGGALENTLGATLTVTATGAVTSSGGLTNAGTVVNRGNFTSNSLLTNAVTGVLTNELTFNQFAAATNNGIVNNKGTFSCPQVFTNNKTVNNQIGGTWLIDFGGSFLNESGATLTNAAILRNFSTFENTGTVTNTGTFANFGTHTCKGVFNNESGGAVESNATTNLSGTWTNKLGSSLTTGFRFNILAGGVLTNLGNITNRDQIDVRVGGTLTAEATSQITMSFGSSLLNAGLVLQKIGSSIVSNGKIDNSNVFENNGTIDSQDGSQVINSDTLINTGLLKSVNIQTNSNYFENRGRVECGGGNIWTNTGKVLNTPQGLIINGFDIFNRVGAEFLNNGTIYNLVRVTNESSNFVNNGYFACAGDLLNRIGATFTNTEAFNVVEGSILNEGSFLNNKTLLIQKCGTLSNKASFTNNERAESSGIVFQRGTWTGNALVKLTGIYTTSLSSETADICRATVRAGTDLTGKAKVDAPSVLLPTVGLDSCFGFQYFVNGLNRATYACSDIGTTIPSRLKIILRTGDSLTCSTNIEIFDGVAPLISGCPQSLTLFTTASSTTYSWTQPTATDNCGGVPTFTSTTSSGSSFPLGTTEVIIKAKDAVNNEAECRFKVTVIQVPPVGNCPTSDVTPPVITNCPANRTVEVAEASAVSEETWATPSVSDACLPVRLTSNFASGQRFTVGTHTVIFTATDPSNNSSTCSFTIKVNGPDNPCISDIVKPVFITCPANVYIQTNTASGGAFAIWTTPSVFDLCSAVTLTTTRESGTFFTNGITQVVYTATDASSNVSTCVFNVNVAPADPCPSDVTPPSLSACPANISITIQTGNSSTANWTAPTAIDACSPITINATHESGSIFNLGETTVTYAARDGKGNSSSCSFKVTVSRVLPCDVDATPPVFANCPANITVVADTNATTKIATWTAPTASDNCAMPPSVTASHLSGQAFPVGTTTVSYVATDLKNNRSTCSFTVQVFTPCDLDNQPPVFTFCPPDTVVRTASTFTNVTWREPTATDNCTNPPVLTSNRANGSQFVIGLINTIIYEATDARGLKSECSFKVTMLAVNPCELDIKPPVFANCPANISVLTTTNSAIANWTAPTATDSCSTPSVIASHQSGTSFSIGTTTVSYVATDAKGNKATCSFNIIVTQTNNCTNDTQVPVFANCPANINLTTNATTTTVNWAAPTATDNCDTPSVIASHQSGANFPIGSTTVSYVATDAKGNKATCSFNVVITQQTTGSYCVSSSNAPWQDWITRVTFNGINNASDKYIGTSYGYSDFSSISTSVMRGQTFPLSITPGWSWSGRVPLQYCRVWIDFNADGDFADLGELVLEQNGRNAYATNVLIPATATAGRVRMRVSLKANAFAMPCENFAMGEVEDYTLIIGGSMTDCATETQPPVIENCPANITVLTTDNTAIADWTAPTATDNCSVPTLTSTANSGSSFPIGTTTVTYTARDARNNSATCSFTVTANRTNVASPDIALSISSDLTLYRPYSTVHYRIVAQNIGSQSATTIKITFPYPDRVVTGGTATPSVGTWTEYCLGGVRCYEWTILSLVSGAAATLDLPLFILNATAPLVATARYVSSTPTDGNATNNSATSTINLAPVPSNFERFVPSQRVPIVVYDIFPNPTDADVSIKLNSLTEREVTFGFYDVAGKKVLAETRIVEKGANALTFNVLALSQGVYMVVPSTNLGKGTPVKFVKL